VTRPEDAHRTPIYLKTDREMAWPDDTFFYVMTGDGLFVCRNHPFFRSCVPARRWPSDLARQEPFLKASYPKIPKAMIERIVGFFSMVADEHNSEAGVMLAWDEPGQKIHVVVPEQVATVSYNWRGDPFPIGLKYVAPPKLPAGWVILGDVHSHVDYWPNPSYIDDLDESYRAGVHVVVGHIRSEPPEFHAEAVVDGQRFTLREQQIMEGYARRSHKVPRAWFEKLKIKAYGYYRDEDDDKPAKASKKQGRAAGGNGKSRDTEDDVGATVIDVSPAQPPDPDQYPDPDPDPKPTRGDQA
jgi:hypothetical protein